MCKSWSGTSGIKCKEPVLQNTILWYNFRDGKEEQHMDPMDLVQDKFSQDCTIETVLHLLMAHFNLSEEEAQAKIDEYFEIVEGYSK